MQITLKDELKNLRVSFHLKLATKRDISIDKEEVVRLVNQMGDEEVQNHIAESYGFRRWFSLGNF